MTTMPVQRPNLATPVTPTFTQCTTADKFSVPTASGSYLLYYKNAGTITGTLFMNEQVATSPTASTPAAPAGATKWSDAKLATSIAATTERAVFIDDISPYVDATLFANLQHTTPTTLTLCVMGPF